MTTSGANPSSSNGTGQIILTGYFPFVRINWASFTGTSFQGRVKCYKVGNTIPTVSTTGGITLGIEQTTGDNNPNTFNVPDAASSGLLIGQLGFNGTTWDRMRLARVLNFPASTTLTSRNAGGVQLIERPSRWTVVSNPASGSQATASLAAEAAVRHVADCISMSANAAGATVATNLTVNLRDGATGAGTIIWTTQLGATVLAAGGYFNTPYTVCGLNLVGTTNTAMTLEYSAGLAGLIESVSLSGFNVN